ncbi:hypothetical protein [Flavobacterium flavigenum]|uniref:hypothetical protein n=1 Tax=Flavobacterium flavigenum TaxID=3003258 RepID=UPI0022AC27AA|nr:hypothetical protein [Flavobacterium flavigenum]
MKATSKEIFNSSSDILTLVFLVKEIGWNSIRQQSIQRVVYLSKVLYSFVNKENKNPFEYYHFTASLSGPYADIINNSILYLKSNEYISDDDGELKILDAELEKQIIEDEKFRWLKTIVYILGVYGENKIFGFTINDPLYKDAVQRNEPKELDTSPDNKTIKVLSQFKEAFEETLEDVSKIDKKEYLELYFEYIFSKIIKREV